MTLRILLVAAALCAAAGAALAHEYKLGDLQIGHPWSRATPKGASVGAGYLKVTNGGKEADRLVGGSAPFAGKFEIHEIAMKDGVAQMRPLEKGLEIRPGQTVELKPGSYHLMFVGLKTPLEKGQRVKGELNFEKAGKVEVEFVVEAAGATPQGHSGHSGH